MSVLLGALFPEKLGTVSLHQCFHAPVNISRQADSAAWSVGPHSSAVLLASGTHLVDRYHLACLPVPVGLRPKDAHLQADKSAHQVNAAD